MSPERISSIPYSYASDIWSAGLSLLECATGAYPYPEEETCIGMAQTILEAEAPTPPSGASSEFSEFIAHCLDKDPRKRLPAEILLTAPWLQKLHAVSMATSIAALQDWIRDTPRFETPTPQLAPYGPKTQQTSASNDRTSNAGQHKAKHAL